MENSKPAVKPVQKKKKNKKKLIAILTIIVLAAGIGTAVYMQKTAAAKKQTTQQTATVRKGNISVTVTGSGTLVSENKSDVTTSLDGTVKKIYHKEGDKVKAGDLIMSLDDTDAQLNVEKAQSNLDQAKVSLNSNLTDLASLTVKAPFDGEIVEIPVKIGDSVAKNGTVLTLTDKSTFKLVIPFKNNIRSSLHKGMKVDVTAYDSSLDELTSLNGTIKTVNGASYKGADGIEVYNVEIAVENNGVVKENTSAGAEITVGGTTYTGSTTGTLTYGNSRMVKCSAGGNISALNVSVGQVVKKGKVLAKLTNSDLEMTKATNDLKVKSLESELTAAMNQLGYCSIKAPIDGMVAKLNYKEGNSVKMGATLLTMTDLDNMEFDIPVDELDISKVQVGQSVSVTIDALPETSKKPLEATVSQIALEGTTTSGVTSYAVTVKMGKETTLKDGMNANGEIRISDAKDILLVPIEGVLKRGQNSYLMVKGAETKTADSGASAASGTEGTTAVSGTPSDSGTNSSKSGNSGKGQFRMSAAQKKYYEGASAVKVTTGISNSKFIEITEGVKEGDVIVLPQTTTSSSTTKTSTESNRSGGGGMGFGGPPN